MGERAHVHGVGAGGASYSWLPVGLGPVARLVQIASVWIVVVVAQSRWLGAFLQDLRH